jgi:hypothetical protein
MLLGTHSDGFLDLERVKRRTRSREALSAGWSAALHLAARRTASKVTEALLLPALGNYENPGPVFEAGTGGILDDVIHGGV